jgi:hypothetical protein
MGNTLGSIPKQAAQPWHRDLGASPPEGPMFTLVETATGVRLTRTDGGFLTPNSPKLLFPDAATATAWVHHFFPTA